jgi:hypothetical protein
MAGFERSCDAPMICEGVIRILEIPSNRLIRVTVRKETILKKSDAESNLARGL